MPVGHCCILVSLEVFRSGILVLVLPTPRETRLWLPLCSEDMLTIPSSISCREMILSQPRSSSLKPSFVRVSRASYVTNDGKLFFWTPVDGQRIRVKLNFVLIVPFPFRTQLTFKGPRKGGIGMGKRTAPDRDLRSFCLLLPGLTRGL